jgi:tetratricopeptide (TPR) repeat protein
MKLEGSLTRAPAPAGVLHWTMRLTALFAVLALAGCATPQLAQLEKDWPADLPVRIELTQVPFYPQEDFECGPAALAMAATAAGVTLRPEQLVEQVYLPGRKGSLQLEMLAAGRRQGLLAYPLAPRLESVLREVAAGHPVIVFQNLSLPIYPIWHYAVVIGFERERQTLLLHSGRTEYMEMSLATFEHTWARGKYWSMVLLPPAALPATAQPDVHATATAALERVHPQAALAAYTRALQTWPTHKAALLGRGNAAYALGQTDLAVQAYRQAVEVQPDFADAWNNLAQVLLAQNQLALARQAIDQAVTLGGPRLPGYQALQQQIRTRSDENP